MSTRIDYSLAADPEEQEKILARIGARRGDVRHCYHGGLSLRTAIHHHLKGGYMKKITVDAWQNIPAGGEVPSGYSCPETLTAPAEPGVYTLYELADDSNIHCGWRWERQE